MNVDWVEALKNEGKEPADAVAEARAGQILAEMLGMVCHPEYYNSSLEQTVNYPCLARSIFLICIVGYRRAF